MQPFTFAAFRHPGPLGRIVVCFLAFWLWMMPRLMASEEVRGLYEEYGMKLPVPASEEEEVKHSSVYPWPSSGAVPPRALPCADSAPHGADRPLATALQEVPHRPPRG